MWATWNIVAKASLGATASIVLAATTPIPEVLAGLVETEWFREMMVAEIVADGEITEDEAWCLIDELDLVALIAFGRGEEPDAEAMIGIFQAFETCGVAL